MSRYLANKQRKIKKVYQNIHMILEITHVVEVKRHIVIMKLLMYNRVSCCIFVIIFRIPFLLSRGAAIFLIKISILFYDIKRLQFIEKSSCDIIILIILESKKYVAIAGIMRVKISFNCNIIKKMEVKK